ncbi:MAG: hypothetical protein AAFP90_00385 [Planctomycetota bacterium]
MIETVTLIAQTLPDAAQSPLDAAGGIDSGLDSRALTTANAISSQISTAEWLGPMAPIAASPFFGLALLSGAATYGPDWLRGVNYLLSESSALNNPWLFWIMAVLAALTSAPRFTKVSKPIAMAASKLETFSAIVILLVVRFSASMNAPDVNASAVLDNGGLLPVAEIPPNFLIGSVVTLSLDLLLCAVAALNVFVVQSVRLFFEFLIWMVPFPAVDAVLEIANKSVCVALMAIYAYSPTIATILNLLIFAAAMVMFDWSRRRVQYYRSLAVGPLLAMFVPGWFAQRGDSFTAYHAAGIEGMPMYSKVRVQKTSDSTYRLESRWWWRRCVMEMRDCQVQQDQHLTCCETTISGECEGRSETQVVVKHRRWVSNDEMLA